MLTRWPVLHVMALDARDSMDDAHSTPVAAVIRAAGLGEMSRRGRAIAPCPPRARRRRPPRVAAARDHRVDRLTSRGCAFYRCCPPTFPDLRRMRGSIP